MVIISTIRIKFQLLVINVQAVIGMQIVFLERIVTEGTNTEQDGIKSYTGRIFNIKEFSVP